MNLNIDLFKSDILGLNFAYLVLMSPPLWTLYITKNLLTHQLTKEVQMAMLPIFNWSKLFLQKKQAFCKSVHFFTHL